MVELAAGEMAARNFRFLIDMLRFRLMQYWVPKETRLNLDCGRLWKGYKTRKQFAVARAFMVKKITHIQVPGRCSCSILPLVAGFRALLATTLPAVIPTSTFPTSALNILVLRPVLNGTAWFPVGFARGL